MSYLTEEKFVEGLDKRIQLTEDKFSTVLDKRIQLTEKKIGDILEKRLEDHFRFIHEVFQTEFHDLRSQMTRMNDTIDKIYVMLDRDIRWRVEHEIDHATIQKRIDQVETYLGPGFRKTLSA